MSTTPSTATTDVVAREIAHEQAHVDRVYAELGRASERAGLVAQDGLARGRTDRTGDIRDEEITGLFERDALMFHAARRQASLDQQYEGLVFGRLDLVDLGTRRVDPVDELPDEWWLDPDREVRYIGRLGVRDEEYEPLVIDWRAPAASAFYQATPVQPQGVIRRRVLRSSGPTVVGVEALKFKRPLLPGHTVQLSAELGEASDRVRFELTEGTEVISSGRFLLETE